MNVRLTEESREELCRRLREARKRSRVVNVRRASELYGLAGDSVTKVLCGKRLPNVATLIAMADMFETTPGKLLDGLEVS